MKTAALAYHARRAIVECLDVKISERVAIVSDTMQPTVIAESLSAVCASMGIEATITYYEPRHEGLEFGQFRLPDTVGAMLQEADVIVLIGNFFAVKDPNVTKAHERGARSFVLLSDSYGDPTIQSETSLGSFVRATTGDLEEVARLTQKIASAVESANDVHVFTDLGTDLHFKGGNKVQVHDGIAKTPGSSDWFPAGVIAAAPKLGTPNGRVVIDISINPIGSLREPIIIDILDHKIVNVEGGGEAWRLKQYLMSFKDESVWHCPAEWGVGTNPNARVGSFFWEEERILGAGHVAIGDASRFDGGEVASPIHLDGMFGRASVEIDGVLMIDNGQFLI